MPYDSMKRVLVAVLLSGCSDAGPAAAPTTQAEDDSVILSEPPSWIAVGSTFEYRIVLDSEAIVTDVTLDQAPAGMTYDSAFAFVLWTPTADQTGTHAVTLTIHTEGNTFQQEFTLTVASSTEVAQATIGAAGGTLSGDDVNVTIPPGTFAQSVVVSIARWSSAPDLAQYDVTPAGNLYALDVRDANGSAFDDWEGNVTVTLPFDPAWLPDGNTSTLYAARIDMTAEPPVVLAATSAIDSAAGLITFVTPHLSDWGVYTMAAEGFASYSECATDSRFRVRYHSALKTPADQANSYCQTILAGLHAAEANATAKGFKVPAQTQVEARVRDLVGYGYYNYVGQAPTYDWKLRDWNLRSTPAHEYFHAVQDEYYVMTTAALTNTYWWTEASAEWFAGTIEPDSIRESLRATLRGYLLTPLMDSDKINAYGKASFVEFGETKVSDFTRKVFDASSGSTSVTTAINALLPLASGYPEYVLWALGKYGTGPAASDVCGQVTVSENGQLSRDDHFDASQQLMASEQRNTSIAPDSETGVAKTSYSDTSGKVKYRSYVYAVFPATEATTKMISVRFTRAGPASSDTPAVVGYNKAGTKVLQRTLTPNAETFTRVRNVGLGSTDTIAKLYLVYADTSDHGQGTYQWDLEVVEQPPAADIEIPLPGNDEEVSENRVYTPGAFEFPTIGVDLSSDPETPTWRVSVSGFVNDPPVAQGGWAAFGIPAATTTITYGDANVGTFNTARAGNGSPATPAPSLDEFTHLWVWAETEEESGGSVRGSNFVRYLDGEVAFTLAVSPSTIASPSDGHMSTTPVTIVGSVKNDSSLTFVINSLDFRMNKVYEVSANTLREPQTTAYKAIGPGQSDTFTFENYVLQLEDVWIGTTQMPRLEVGFDNASGLEGSPLEATAGFWMETFSDATTLTILPRPVED